MDSQQSTCCPRRHNGVSLGALALIALFSLLVHVCPAFATPDSAPSHRVNLTAWALPNPLMRFFYWYWFGDNGTHFVARDMKHLITQVAQHVGPDGRVGVLTIADHGNDSLQWVGRDDVSAWDAKQWEELAPYLDDASRIVLSGCKVGRHKALLSGIGDGLGVTVEASPDYNHTAPPLNLSFWRASIVRYNPKTGFSFTPASGVGRFLQWTDRLLCGEKAYKPDATIAEVRPRTMNGSRVSTRVTAHQRTSKTNSSRVRGISKRVLGFRRLARATEQP